MKNIRVIFHVDEASKWPLVIANVRNLINEMQDDLSKIEVLANAQAVLFLKSDESSMRDELLELVGRQVDFCVCENSMRSFNMNVENFESYVIFVHSGVAYLAYQQASGFVYIKP